MEILGQDSVEINSQWTAEGVHNPSNLNYLVGECRNNCNQNTFYRNFFVFDLTSATQTITGATLILRNPPDDPTTIGFIEGGYNASDQGEIYELHHVSTPLATLLAGAPPSSPNVAVYDDLGDGTLYASYLATFADNAGTYLALDCSSASCSMLQPLPTSTQQGAHFLRWVG